MHLTYTVVLAILGLQVLYYVTQANELKIKLMSIPAKHSSIFIYYSYKQHTEL